MKKLIFIFLLLTNISSYAFKELSTLKTLKFDVKETQISYGTNKNQEKLIEYSITLEFPDKIRKELYYPKINKGEIYLYNGNKKTIYLPIFDEFRESEIDGNENQIIKVLNNLKNIEKDPIKKKKYQQKALDSLFLDNTQVEVKIKKYIEIDDYILPQEVEVYDNGLKLAMLKIEQIFVNLKLEKNIFELKNEEK